MKKLLFLALILPLGVLHAQEAELNTWSYKNKKLNYLTVKTTAKPSHIILSFHDHSDSTLTSAAFLAELKWLAEERNAQLVAPGWTEPALKSEVLSAFIKHLSDSLTSEEVSFVALGNGASSVCQLIQAGISGLLIAPEMGCRLSPLGKVASYGVISTRAVDSSALVVDSLQRFDQWVNSQIVIADHYFFIDNHQRVYSNMMDWNDSVNHVISDSSLRLGLKTELKSEVPDIIRQGNKLIVDITVAIAGDFEINILDLSARKVESIKQFLGKGTYHFVLPTKHLDWGVYKLEVDGPGIIEKHKIIIRG